MICPRGETVHENLSSEYTDVPQLLSSLRAEGFSGTVEIRKDEAQGTFFLSCGEIIETIIGTDAVPLSTVGDEAVEELLILCMRPLAMLNVYRLSTAEVELVAGAIHEEAIFRGLSTDFVRLDRFAKKLSDEKHTGRIEAYTKDNRAAGVLFFRDGILEGAFVPAESGEVEFIQGADTIAFLGEMNSRPLTLTVYRTVLPTSKAGAFRGKSEELFGPVKHEPAGAAAAAGGRIQTKGATQPQDRATVVLSADSRHRLVSDVQSVLTKVEKFVNGVSEKGGFMRAFKRACVEKSESYAFLDPFEGQLDYSGGVLKVDAGVPLEALSLGLADCLNQTLSYLQKELPEDTTFPVGLRKEIESSFGGHPDLIRGPGDRPIVPPAFT